MAAMTLHNLVFLASLTLSSARTDLKPNIVFIVADDLGWADVPWRDPSVPAPNILSLARSGLIFNQSYVQQVTRHVNLNCETLAPVPFAKNTDKHLNFFVAPHLILSRCAPPPGPRCSPGATLTTSADSTGP